MVQIIKGSYGMCVGKTIKPVNAGDDPINLSAEEEERLVRLGVAVKVDNHAESEAKSDRKSGKLAGKKSKEKPVESADEPEDEQLCREDLPNLDASDAVVDD